MVSRQLQYATQVLVHIEEHLALAQRSHALHATRQALRFGAHLSGNIGVGIAGERSAVRPSMCVRATGEASDRIKRAEPRSNKRCIISSASVTPLLSASIFDVAACARGPDVAMLDLALPGSLCRPGQLAAAQAHRRPTTCLTLASPVRGTCNKITTEPSR